MLDLPNIFSDHMVIQQEQPVPIWGRALPNAEVTVLFREQTAQTTASAKGEWKLNLQPEPASFTPAELVVRSATTVKRFGDVLVGEVWLASGQSNMEWAVANSLDADIEILAARHPAIRIHEIERTIASEPAFTNPATWEVCSSETIRDFSAVAYAFGRDLRQILQVPIGLIDATWGGTPAIAWTRESAFSCHPLLTEKAKEWEEDPEADPESPHRPGSLANGMLAPVAPYAIRGAIWYQGEADAGWKPDQYDDRLEVMIGDWRDWWKIPGMPFGIVQLAGYLEPKTEPANDPWPQLRESQRDLARELPHTGLAVAIDIGEVDDIHPRDKRTVGRRLARWALADVYDRIELRGGPEVDSVDWSEDSVTLTFTQTGSGLKPLDGPPLNGFTLSGTAGIFHRADAEILDSRTIRVKAAEVSEPVHLRYGWQNNPVSANLGNEERLPASPFEVIKN